MRASITESVRMRDGVALATDVLLPAAAAAEPQPAVVVRTCYGRADQHEMYMPYVDAGYAIVLQDVRGRFDSEGEWVPFVHEAADGADTVGWVAEQPWCDGQVAAVGASYGGWCCWALAKERPPALRAMVVAVTAGGFGRQEPWAFGSFFLITSNWLAYVAGRENQDTSGGDWQAALTALPLSDLPHRLGRAVPQFAAWAGHPPEDPLWSSLALTDDEIAALDLPVHSTTGWYDSNLRATVELSSRHVRLARGGSHDRLLVGPWPHGGSGEPLTSGEYDGRVFPGGGVAQVAERIAFLDAHLRGGAQPAPSRVYVTGGDWVSTTWPPSSVMREVPLGGGQTLHFDPDQPFGLLEGWDPYGGAASYPTRFLAAEQVAWRTELARGTVLLGDPVVELDLILDGPDADVFAWLIDLGDDSHIVSSGHLRVRYRTDPPTAAVPGEVTRIQVELLPVAHLVAGQLQLALTGSDFPWHDRNLGFGDSPLDATRRRVQNTQVVGGRLLLPVQVRQRGIT